MIKPEIESVTFAGLETGGVISLRDVDENLSFRVYLGTMMVLSSLKLTEASRGVFRINGTDLSAVFEGVTSWEGDPRETTKELMVRFIPVDDLLVNKIGVVVVWKTENFHPAVRKDNKVASVNAVGGKGVLS